MPDLSPPVAALLRRVVRPVALVAWCLLIFAASSRADLRVADDDLLDLLVRKSAHLLEFGVLALLVAWNLRALRGGRARSPRVTAVWSWSATLLYAASDEWHQTFVSGRVGHPRDVAIDMIGATIALAGAHLMVNRCHGPTPGTPPDSRQELT